MQPVLLQVWFLNSELGLNLSAFCYQALVYQKTNKKTHQNSIFPISGLLEECSELGTCGLGSPDSRSSARRRNFMDVSAEE